MSPVSNIESCIYFANFLVSGKNMSSFHKISAVSDVPVDASSVRGISSVPTCGPRRQPCAQRRWVPCSIKHTQSLLLWNFWMSHRHWSQTKHMASCVYADAWLKKKKRKGKKDKNIQISFIWKDLPNPPLWVGGRRLHRSQQGNNGGTARVQTGGESTHLRYVRSSEESEAFKEFKRGWRKGQMLQDFRWRHWVHENSMEGWKHTPGTDISTHLNSLTYWRVDLREVWKEVN